MQIEQLIKEKSDKLPPGQQKVAQFLLDSLDKFAFSTAAQIAREVDVGETTVIRLSYSLGFESFSQMQKRIQNQYRMSKNGENDVISLEKVTSFNEDNLIVNIVENEITILKKILNQLDMNDLWKAVDWLVQADKVVLVGHSSSYPAAHWLYLKLSMLREKVSIIPSNDSTYKYLLNVNKDSVFFLISFSRYTRESLSIAEFAKEEGAKIIAVTDRALSPAGRLSDLVFTTMIDVRSNNIYSISPIISLLNLISSGIEIKYGEQTSLRVQDIQHLQSKLGINIE